MLTVMMDVSRRSSLVHFGCASSYFKFSSTFLDLCEVCNRNIEHFERGMSLLDFSFFTWVLMKIKGGYTLVMLPGTITP
jgi:hypothetical protein